MWLSHADFQEKFEDGVQAGKKFMLVFRNEADTVDAFVEYCNTQAELDAELARPHGFVQLKEVYSLTQPMEKSKIY